MLDGEEAEALAVHRVVEFALEIGIRDVMLEGDASSLLAALKQKEPIISKTGNVLYKVEKMGIFAQAWSTMSGKNETTLRTPLRNFLTMWILS